VAVQVDIRDEEIDLRSVAALLWGKRLWIIASIVAFTIPFGIIAYLSEPQYRASTVLVDARADNSAASALSTALGQLGGIANLARINVSSPSQVEEALAVIKSRDFTERFIEDEHLLPALFPDLWDADGQRWLTETGKPPTLVQGFKVFDQIRTVSPPARGGLVTLTILWEDPVQAADWANKLVARLNSEMRARAIANTAKAVSYLEKELESTSTLGTQQALYRLIETQINQRMLANVTQEYAFRVVDKALPADPDDAVGTSKIVLLALGPSIGLIFGVFAVLAANMLLAKRDTSPAS
jgi:uncharacterized protein involved in exopolysaccharide biosynthesis